MSNEVTHMIMVAPSRKTYKVSWQAAGIGEPLV